VLLLLLDNKVWGTRYEVCKISNDFDVDFLYGRAISAGKML